MTKFRADENKWFHSIENNPQLDDFFYAPE